MALKAGKHTNKPVIEQTQKERAIAAVQEVEVKVKTQRFNVDMPEELHSKIKIQAIKEGIKLNTLTIKIFEEYLKNNS